MICINSKSFELAIFDLNSTTEGIMCYLTMGKRVEQRRIEFGRLGVGVISAMFLSLTRMPVGAIYSHPSGININNRPTLFIYAPASQQLSFTHILPGNTDQHLFLAVQANHCFIPLPFCIIIHKFKTNKKCFVT